MGNADAAALNTPEQALRHLAQVLPGKDYAVAHTFSIGWVCVPALSEEQIADGEGHGLIRALVDKHNGQVFVYPSWPAQRVASDYLEALDAQRPPAGRQIYPKNTGQPQPEALAQPEAQPAPIPTDAMTLFSGRFLKWAERHAVSVSDMDSGAVAVHHKDWGRHIVRLLESGQVQVLRDYDPPDPRFTVHRGNDLERVLYQQIGDKFRFQQGMRPIEYPPELARGWMKKPQQRLVDPAGRERYRANHYWNPEGLSHLLNVSPRSVARSYSDRRGMPLRRVLARNSGRQLACLLVTVVLIGAISWAATAGDTALTVTLFVLTGIPAAAAMVAISAGVLLNAVDANAPLRGRALAPVVTLLGFLGVIVEVIAAYLAMQAPGSTWYYPLAAVAVIAIVGVVIFLIGVIAD